MTNSREYNAGTVQEALQKAAVRLGLAADELSYEVLDTGSEGFLGIGARDARILVHVAGETEEPAETLGFEEIGDETARGEGSVVPSSVEVEEVPPAPPSPDLSEIL